jgi:hypothetical protein
MTQKHKKIIKTFLIPVFTLGFLYYYYITFQSQPKQQQEKLIDVPVPAEEQLKADSRKVSSQKKTQVYINEEEEMENEKALALSRVKEDPGIVASSFEQLNEKKDSKLTRLERQKEEIERIKQNSLLNANAKSSTEKVAEPEVIAPTAKPTQQSSKVVYQQPATQSHNEGPTEPKKNEKEPFKFNTKVIRANQNTTEDLYAFKNGQVAEPQQINETVTDAYIEAVVYGDQKVQSGDPVKMRLRKEATVSGVRFPRNTVFTALAQWNGERMQIVVNGLMNGRDHIPTNLNVYDTDNIRGIYVPLDPSLQIASQEGAQAVTNAIQQTGANNMVEDAVRGVTGGIFNQKARIVKVFLPDAYEVSLRPY